MSNISLKLEMRETKGKKVAELRRQDIVPSVVYGGQSTPIDTQSGLVETTKVVRAAGKHSPVDITIEGKKKLAIIKSIDIDPVKHVIRHVAFHTIKQNEKIVTEVPLHLVGLGESIAERAGLVILQAIEHVEVRALPVDLPDAIEMSVAGLETDDDKLTIADVKLPAGVEFADHEQNLDLVVANVYEPGALQAANESAGGDAEDETDVESENGASDEESVDEDTSSKPE